MTPRLKPTLRKIFVWAQLKGSREMHRERKALRAVFIDVVVKATIHRIHSHLPHGLASWTGISRVQ
jgi:hypothetical protein